MPEVSGGGVRKVLLLCVWLVAGPRLGLQLGLGFGLRPRLELRLWLYLWLWRWVWRWLRLRLWLRLGLELRLRPRSPAGVQVAADGCTGGSRNAETRESAVAAADGLPHGGQRQVSEGIPGVCCARCCKRGGEGWCLAGEYSSVAPRGRGPVPQSRVRSGGVGRSGART